MNITKIGHCCFYIKENGVGILTDPGAWSTGQNSLSGIDIILITHEHADHFHTDSIKEVLKNNPDATVVTNSAVSNLLKEQGIACEIIEDGQQKTIQGIEIAGYGKDHAVIYKTIPVVMNTGYFIANKFFLPGDAFVNPGVPIEILGMPMIGPWMKLSESIDWALSLKPKVCIPIHDGMLTPRQWIYIAPTKVLGEAGIQFDVIESGQSIEY
ncbi:MAG TPA: MBL fold metallo-hydrolase [Candidatus Andersenbacteria bacterium]|nr:MBL fold metallo-hydrolase [Candidatus Andersenbacteria bacterium]